MGISPQEGVGKSWEPPCRQYQVRSLALPLPIRRIQVQPRPRTHDLLLSSPLVTSHRHSITTRMTVAVDSLRR